MYVRLSVYSYKSIFTYSAELDIKAWLQIQKNVNHLMCMDDVRLMINKGQFSNKRLY